MPYCPPAFVEIKMDSEIGSYQDDFEFDRGYEPLPRFPEAAPASQISSDAE